MWFSIKCYFIWHRQLFFFFQSTFDVRLFLFCFVIQLLSCVSLRNSLKHVSEITKVLQKHECLILMIIPHVWVSQSKYNTTRSQRGPIYQLSMGQNRTEMIGRAWVKCNKFLLYFTSYVIYLSIVKLQTFLWFHKLFIYGFLFTYFPHIFFLWSHTFRIPKKEMVRQNDNFPPENHFRCHAVSFSSAYS